MFEKIVTDGYEQIDGYNYTVRTYKYRLFGWAYMIRTAKDYRKSRTISIKIFGMPFYKYSISYKGFRSLPPLPL